MNGERAEHVFWKFLWLRKIFRAGAREKRGQAARKRKPRPMSRTGLWRRFVQSPLALRSGDCLHPVPHWAKSLVVAAAAKSTTVALRFIDALEAAYEHIRRAPATGSPYYAHELNLPGLRVWRCKRYPYLVFYVEHADRIEVWRVLHARRDIPQWLQDGTEPSSR